MDQPKATRRGVLQKGVLLLGGVAGALGLAGAASAARQKSGPLVLYGVNWHQHTRDVVRGQLPQRGDSVSQFGELLDGPAGKRVGEFYSSSLFLGSPLGQSPLAAAHVELHVFNLEAGSLFGVGSASGGRGTYAIVGGTGRYAGAGGTYTSRQEPLEIGGDGTAEFNLSLTGGVEVAHGSS